MGRLASLALLDVVLINVAFSAPTTSWDQGRRFNLARQLDLNPSSTCNEEKPDVLQSYMYDETDTHNHLQAFMDDHPGETNFVFDFATPQGVGQSFGSCHVTQPCERPDCDDLQDPNAPLSAAGYNALVSIANFSKYMAAVYSSFMASQARFATLQAALQNDFYPVNPPNNLVLNEFIDAIQTIVNTVSEFFVGPGPRALAAFTSGTLNSVKDALQQNADPLSHLAEVEQAVDNFVQSSLSGIITANDDMVSTGQHDGQQLLDLFDGGSMLDYRNMPLLNTDTSKPQISTQQANDAFFTLIMAQLINYSWKKQNTYIMSYPMTEDEFNGKSVAAGSNDSRLKLYYNGRGYYYQSMSTVDNGIIPSNPNNIDPPGWGTLGEYNIDFSHPIKSSADAYDQGGFDFHADDIADSILGAGIDFAAGAVAGIAGLMLNGSPESTSLPGTSVPGIFSLPICAMDNNTPDAPDIDTFISLLNGPNTNFGGLSVVGTEAPPSFCFCLGITDKNGKSFGDAGDWNKWHQYCPQNNPYTVNPPTSPASDT